MGQIEEGGESGKIVCVVGGNVSVCGIKFCVGVEK